MNAAEYDPLSAPAPAEIPLTQAPLVRVIAQLRFPPVISVEKREFVAPFQEAIRGLYPVLRPEQIQELIFSTNGVESVAGRPVWRFSDIENRWRVSLASNFLALETTSYISREDYLSRLEHVFSALAEHIGPEITDRFGLRYINRVTGSALDDLHLLIKPAALGIDATSMAKRAKLHLTQALFSIDGGAQMNVRWGRMPPLATVDPTALEPIPEQSWLLDLDTFREEPSPFRVDKLIEDSRHYAERLYAFFRWAITDEFLKRYGGKP